LCFEAANARLLAWFPFLLPHPVAKAKQDQLLS